MRLLQQTVRSSQYDKYFASSRLSEGVPKDALDLLHRKDDQILGLSGQLERLTLERESLQQEVRTLKGKVGELSEQLGMLVETIQAKDEVIMKLSRQLSESEDSTSSPTGVPGSPAGREQLELDRLKVSGVWAPAAGRGSDRRCGRPLDVARGCRPQCLVGERGVGSAAPQARPEPAPLWPHWPWGGCYFLNTLGLWVVPRVRTRWQVGGARGCGRRGWSPCLRRSLPAPPRQES